MVHGKVICYKDTQMGGDAPIGSVFKETNMVWLSSYCCLQL